MISTCYLSVLPIMDNGKTKLPYNSINTLTIMTPNEEGSIFYGTNVPPISTHLNIGAIRFYGADERELKA